MNFTVTQNLSDNSRDSRLTANGKMKKSYLFVVAMILALGILIEPDTVSAETYDVYLLAGQSNMDGRGKASNLSENQRRVRDDAIIYYRNVPHTSGGWKPLGPGYSIAPKYDGDLPSSTFGPELGFADALVDANSERKLALIKGSKGGSSLRKDWNPGEEGKPETQGQRYRDFCETIRLATDDLTKQGHHFKICGLLWHQGESDSKSSTEVYQTRLLELVRRLRQEVDVDDLAVVVGEVFDNGKRDRVRAALHSVGTSGSRFGFVSSKGTTTWDEGTHFDAASQILLGQRYAEAMLHIEKQ